MTVIDELHDAGRRVRDAAGPAVVRIGRSPGRGSGVVTAPGVVVTNAHNLRGDEVTVTFADGRQVVAAVAGVDPEGDLAALTVDTGDAAPLAVADGPAVETGRPVFALGAIPGGGARVSFGVVSATGRHFRGPGGRLISDAVEHTAPLAPGSSGGPLVDGDGRLLGLNTHRLDAGFYLALPVTADLLSRIAALAEGRVPERRHLGVAITPARAARRLRDALGLPERNGVLVAAVEDGSPAAAAGLRRGDLIVGAGGVPVSGADDLFAALAGSGPAISLRVLRQLEEIDVEVTFPAGSGPASPSGDGEADASA